MGSLWAFTGANIRCEMYHKNESDPQWEMLVRALIYEQPAGQQGAMQEVGEMWLPVAADTSQSLLWFVGFRGAATDTRQSWLTWLAQEGVIGPLA